MRTVTCLGSWEPGVAGIPVIKSAVMKVRMTMERWQEGVTGRCWGSRSKCMGMSTIGIWLIEAVYPREGVGRAHGEVG